MLVLPTGRPIRGAGQVLQQESGRGCGCEGGACMSVVLRECACCGECKPWDPNPFIRDNKVSGFRGSRCWGCHLGAHREASREPNRRWRAANVEVAREAQRRWRETNPEALREAKRRRSIYAAPEWDREAIKTIETQATVQGLGTDHIFPILAVDPKTGLRASGLHRSWNLQPMAAAANISTGNRFDFELEAQRLMAVGRGSCAIICRCPST